MTKPNIEIRCAFDEMVPIDQLKPHSRNRNFHPESQIAALAKILQYQGFRYPVKVSKRSGFITSGHGRLLAAKKIGMEAVPVNFQEYDSEEMELADLTADNIIASRAEFDLAGFQQDAMMFGQDFDKDLFGFEDIDSILPRPSGLTDPDYIPEQVEPRTKSGDIYRLGNHRLICGDSTSSDTVLKLMGGELADMIWTDPPYNVAVTGGTHDPRDKKNHGKGPTIMNDSMPDEEFKKFLLDSYSCMYMVAKPGAAIYVAHADTEGVNFRSAMKESGFLLKQCLIWVKQQFVFGRSDYHWQHEPILYGWKDGAGHSFYGERNQSTTWNVDRPMRSEKEHPTQKPVALVEKAILNSSKSGDLMFEPFGGGGSTVIAAEKLGRRCNAMELDPKYCDVIIARWEAYTGCKAVLV